MVPQVSEAAIGLLAREKAPVVEGKTATLEVFDLSAVHGFSPPLRDSCGLYPEWMSTTQRYPSDLTDLQWDSIEHLFPRAKGKRGPPRTYPLRGIVNAARYLAGGGCT